MYFKKARLKTPSGLGKFLLVIGLIGAAVSFFGPMIWNHQSDPAAVVVEQPTPTVTVTVVASTTPTPTGTTEEVSAATSLITSVLPIVFVAMVLLGVLKMFSSSA